MCPGLARPFLRNISGISRFSLNLLRRSPVIVIERMENGNVSSDDDLMRAFQSGDVEAFEKLVERWRGPLWAFASGMTSDPATVDDIVQETFVRIYEQHRDYIATGRFRPWIYTIARNLCRDRFRQPTVRSLDLDAPLILWSRLDGTTRRARSEAGQDRGDRIGRIARAAEDLSEPMREVVLLKYYHGLKAKEIAEVAGCPVGTVKSRLHYALKRIERMVAD